MESPDIRGGDGSDFATLETAEKIILRWDSTTSEEAKENLIFQSDREEVDRYLQAVDEVQRLVSSVSISDSDSRHEDELRNILLSQTSTFEPDSLLLDSSASSFATRADLEDTETAPPDDAEGEEQEEMNLVLPDGSDSNSGSDPGSSRLSSRRSSCKSTSSIREIDLVSSEAVSDLRSIVRRMIGAGYSRECLQACVRVVFASEKRLCEQIFDGGEVEETCFMEIVKSSALQLLTFPEAISISRRSPEKLFKILDLHDALADLLPDMEEIFNSESSETILAQATEIQSRLAEAARGTLVEFENAIFREPSVVPVPGGTIHPLTRYVMNYLNLIADYKQTLVELVMSKPCAVQKVKSSPELREIIGDFYLRRLTGIFRHAATKYQRATWVRVLNSLRDEGLHVSGSFSSGVSKSALRERFKAFNTMFEEVHRVQSTWSVPDAQLREELRISLSEHLIPAYRSFLGRFRGHIESGRHPENYLKYSVENLETAVLDFFEGYTTAPHLRRSQ
ncbi:BnaC03g78240D [Brassica napus]|uniref:Exocyst subunit Exo70 family protein n=1 Tax=Brassica napus TaxID=3708 RepID=A0A078J856_BRANA|nr:BnaC03g78240D [Brassica napus]